ncbi:MULTISPECIES: NnrU family protein [Leptolyngbya]|nr:MULTISPECIES: NnrU family protein [Leptolyngbya]MBD2368448.1 hypothetical protein [Leptolyngbya sp. FACHB-161]MBD2374896.1 hypothetical protein [Leptolyngbya sp. FACHB-238]MBD2399316.1 hypothetical protein [Leptolyngbya sp. FACHB-239]MBD2405521.1 hypothetical protein [Leptolyngbya sp. FACHB-402]ULP32297.1 hypothetical protein MCP04_11110 [Leptolyngbya boryana IU 594]
MSWFTSSHLIMFGWLVGFAIAHSGLASLRMMAEQRIGARFYRVIFALVSLGIAVPMMIYFFNHRYDGLQLWNVQGIPGVSEAVWIGSAISFLFLYPATFNLLEIAAIQKPQVHLYESGIIRISRHPQMVGQILWCITHTVWIGTSFMVVTSIGLILHHLFGVWNGDRRLALRYGEAFEAVKARTSIVPFGAIFSGKQKLDLKEFLRPAYLGVTAFTLLFWWLHPIVIRASGNVPW